MTMVFAAVLLIDPVLIKANDAAPKQPAGNSTQPVGLFVCRGPGPTPENEVNFPFVNGWLVRPGWDLIEPKEGEYDWSYIESEIALAKKLHKKIALAVLGGPQTPAWVYAAGAKEFAFTMPWKFAARGGEAKIPVIWDEIYLKKWSDCILALGKKFKGEDTVILVHMTGATANGLEMFLPFTPEQRDQWIKTGYTPEKVIAAWKQIIDAYVEVFPNKPLDIDIHPVLDTNQVAEEVAAYGSRKLGGRFGIFGGWLSGKTEDQDRHHAGMHALAMKYGPQGFAAFQMIGSFTRTPGRYPEGGLKAAFQQGLSWNARYFEIWQSDAMNPDLQPMLTATSAELLR